VPSLELAPGSFFAQDFRVISTLGKGGMGVVYLVEQLSTGKKRALKLMQPSAAADATMRERFVQEARVGAMIQSEHIVEVIGAGVDQWTGVQWLAMELLEGEDLGTYVRKRGSLTPPEVYEILSQLCHGLAAAHAIPVVHRDLKPENIYLARSKREGGRVLVKILDFGIAKIVTASMTATTTMGTPLWMAPEQASTKTRISPAADVWALGLIAFYMFAGRPYWREQTSAMELLQEIVIAPLDPPSSRAQSFLLRTPLPPGFDAWFQRCVARDPGARFPTAGEAWKALAPVLGGSPDGNRPSAVPSNALGGAPAPWSGAQQPTVAGGPPAAAAFMPTPPPQHAPTPMQPSGRASYPQSANVSYGHAPPMRAPDAGGGGGNAAVLVAGGVGALVLLSIIGIVAVVAVRGSSTKGTDGTAEAGLAASRAREGGGSATSSRDAETGEMVHFSGGTFQVGDDAFPPAAPRHKVTVAPFSLDITEVTVKAYRKCVDAGRCTTPLGLPGSNWNVEGRDSHPINYLDWAAGRTFCEWADKRLPTEEEWEFAASGGVAQHVYPWGIGDPTLGVCFNKGASGSTCEVKKSDQDVTPEGLYDMAGNVNEWTTSLYCPYSDPGCKQDAFQPFRVARGGNFTESTPFAFHNTFRFNLFESGSAPFTGVRCAR
jgi:serine/threonine protein kinase/formylglycine-generating enzyme required for sulfatase activity